jgi:opacity protein-like surface antigen
MRRVMLMLAAMAVMVSLFAAAAYAAEIWGTSQNDKLFESNLDDKIYGRQGNDYIDAMKYKNDRDKVYGNRDDDIISVKDDDEEDYVDGGQGYDKCWADIGELDRVINCEKVNGFPIQ